MRTRLYGSNCQMRPEENCSRRQARPKLLTWHSQGSASILKGFNILALFRALGIGLNSRATLQPATTVRVVTTMRAKASMERGSLRHRDPESKFRTTVKSLWMASSCANVGKLGVVRQKSSQANVAWWDITCAGRKGVTKIIRAMSAHTDLDTMEVRPISPLRVFQRDKFSPCSQ